MDFEEAMKALKEGEKVKRADWKGNRYLFQTKINLQEARKYGIMSDIVVKTAQNKFIAGWLASQTDMLAEDWTITE